MRETRVLMGMPIEVEVLGPDAKTAIEDTFAYFEDVDARFSTYKSESEIMRINRKELAESSWSDDMNEVLALAEKTRLETDGYFDARKPEGDIDPSGIVKGWAIQKAAEMLVERGVQDFFINAGGDIASEGNNANGEPWSVGVLHPFTTTDVVKVVYPKGKGVATSGSYVRGAHIYNPHNPAHPLTDVVSITVIGPDVLEADRFATAAFAMGRNGIDFIERMPGLEGYQIDSAGTGTMTTGFENYTKP